MPADYAHYRFGKAVFSKLPEPVREAVRKAPQLYLAGLQGPDPLFFYFPIHKNKVGALGSELHMQSGSLFFENAVRRLPRTPQAMSYLFGMLGHYCLDKFCHPLINRWAEEGIVGHSEVEADLERHLLALDGRPCTYDNSPHIRLTRQEIGAIACFYPQLTPHQLAVSFRHMHLMVRSLTLPEGLPRNLLRGVMNLGGDYGCMVTSSVPNPRCTGLLPPLMERYRQALEAFPGDARALYLRITEKIPLGSDFAPIFG